MVIYSVKIGLDSYSGGVVFLILKISRLPFEKPQHQNGERYMLYEKKIIISVLFLMMLSAFFLPSLHAEENVSQESRQSAQEEPPCYRYPMIDRIGFLREKPLTPAGIIFKVKGDHDLIGKGDEVYIKETGNIPIFLGRYYMVFKLLEAVTGGKTEQHSIQYYMTGIIETTRKVEPSLIVGKVIQSFRTISINDQVMPHISRSPKIPMAENVRGLEGKIIASEEGTGMIGQNSIAFIDRGIKDGMNPGQKYYLYYQEEMRPNSETEQKIRLPRVNIGSFVVLYSEESTSTVLIVQSDKEIYPGTKFHSQN